MKLRQILILTIAVLLTVIVAPEIDKLLPRQTVVNATIIYDNNISKIIISDTFNIVTDVSKFVSVSLDNNNTSLTYSKDMIEIVSVNPDLDLKFTKELHTITIDDNPRNKYKTILAHNKQNSISIMIENNPIK